MGGGDGQRAGKDSGEQFHRHERYASKEIVNNIFVVLVIFFFPPPVCSLLLQNGHVIQQGQTKLQSAKKIAKCKKLRQKGSSMHIL